MSTRGSAAGTVAGRLTPAMVTGFAAATALLVAAGTGWQLSQAPAMLRVTLPAGRALLDGCAVAATGLAVHGWLARPASWRDSTAGRTPATQSRTTQSRTTQARTTQARTARAAVVLGGLWAATAVLLLWLQSAEVAAQSPAEVGIGAVASYVGSFQPATALLVVAGCAAGFTAATHLRAPPELLVVLAIGGLLPPALTGHASSAPLHELAALSVAVHAAAAAVWVGGLAALLVLAAGRRAQLATVLPRFSAVATAALAAVAVSGVTTATARLGSAADLVQSGYGRIVLVKAAVLLALAGIGALARQRVLPAVRAHRRAPLLAVAGAELILMAVALGLAAALTRTSP